MTRILAFTPYAEWQFHTRYEVTISRAARLRGAEVRHILCDGQMAECDMYTAATFYPAGRPLDLCQKCQSGARDILRQSGMDCEWIGEIATQQQKKEAIAWAQNLRIEELENAHFYGWPLGEWITTSVVSYFRDYPIRFDNWHHVTVWRGFLQGAAITALVIEHILEEWKPDALLMFNGRMGPLRVALSLARARGVRVLVHERPLRPGAVFLYENTPANSPRPFQDYALEWRDVALTTAQLQMVQTWLLDRRFPPDRGLDLLYAKTPQGAAALFEQLNLDSKKPVWALFTSSTDEFMGEPLLVGPFGTQERWIEGIIEWVAQNPQIQLVIRVHPNVGGAGLSGVAKSQAQWFEELSSHLPANVRLVKPQDPLSAYDLMDLCSAALTYGTTAGLETLALGKPVLTVPPIPIYECAQGVILVERAEKLEESLCELVQRKRSIEAMRGAFRCIYNCVFGFQKQFPLVRVEGRVISHFAYSDESALLPGHDVSLDRICDFLLENRPLFDAPTSEDLTRSTANEDIFFAALEANSTWLKPKWNVRRLRMKANGLRKGALRRAKSVLGPFKRRLGF